MTYIGTEPRDVPFLLISFPNIPLLRRGFGSIGIKYRVARNAMKLRIAFTAIEFLYSAGMLWWKKIKEKYGAKTNKEIVAMKEILGGARGRASGLDSDTDTDSTFASIRLESGLCSFARFLAAIVPLWVWEGNETTSYIFSFFPLFFVSTYIYIHTCPSIGFA